MERSPVSILDLYDIFYPLDSKGIAIRGYCGLKALFITIRIIMLALKLQPRYNV